MGKMKDFFKRKSIKTAFTIYMLVCIFSALLLSLALSNFCQWGQSRYYKKYQIQFGVSNPEMVIGFDKTEGNISYILSDATEFKGSFYADRSNCI